MASRSRRSGKPDTPESAVDRLLAAPDEVIQSPRELAKLRDRKAREAARRAREVAAKRRDPTQEDLLADIVRVAEDEATNPWHEFRSVSKRRYELYGHFPVEAVTRLFGHFEHAKQQAGLADTVGTRQFARARTAASLREHDERYMRRYLLPHVAKFDDLARAKAGTRVGLVISDLHSLHLDPFVWLTFLDAAADLEPDVVYLNGDVIDGGEISTHPKVPGSRVPLQLEIDHTRGLLREIRAAVPSRTRIVWGAGNHFLDRLVRYLTQVAPALAGLRTLRVDHLLELGDLDVELVQGGTFVSPKGTEEDEPRRILWETYMVTHGTRLGKHPASSELAQWGMSGTSGHVHRAAVHYGSTYAHRGLTWMSTPMACVEDAGRHYIRDHAGWQGGFGVFFVEPTRSRVHHYPVVCDGGVAIVEGKRYERAKVLPTGGAALARWWTDRMGLDRGAYL